MNGLVKSFIVVLFFAIFAAGVIGITQKQTLPSTTTGTRQTPFFPIPNAKPSETDVHSSDGTMKLIMRRERKLNQPEIYSFFSADIEGKNEQLIFTKAVSNGGGMSLPQNSWSPDNKLVFIEEQEPATKSGTPALSHVLVFKASGEPFGSAPGKVSAGETYFDVPTLFAQKVQNYSFAKVTGWASPTLIIVATTTETGTKGPSYWFEIPSKAFLQLAR